MAIPASHIVQVNPRVITAGSDDLEMNGLLISRSPLTPALTVLPFGSPKAVSVYYGDGSDEALAAQAYFSGYDNKFTSPRVFYVMRRIDEPAAAWLRGAKFGGTLADIKAVTSGTLSFPLDDGQVTLEDLDFSGVTSLSGAAAVIQGGGGACAVTYSSLTGAFQITSNTSGADGAVGHAAGSVAELLGLTEDAGAAVSPGSDALSEAAQMEAALTSTENFVSFTTSWEADDDELEGFAAWAGGHYGYLYAPWTAEPSVLSPTSDTDPASLLKSWGHDHVAVTFGRLRHAAFILGVIASIPWLRLNGTITLAFKRQTGLEATVSDKAQAETLEAKNCNYYGNFATRNADFRFLYPGVLSSSDYRYIDSYINGVWLNAMIQRALLDGMVRHPRVPYSQRGYNTIRAWFMDPVSKAVNNGTIEKGVTLSAAQVDELLNEAGRDISAELSNYGYHLQVLDPGAEARYRRESPIVSLWYTYAGSVQKLDVASTAIL